MSIKRIVSILLANIIILTSIQFPLNVYAEADAYAETVDSEIIEETGNVEIDASADEDQESVETETTSDEKTDASEDKVDDSGIIPAPAKDESSPFGSEEIIYPEYSEEGPYIGNYLTGSFDELFHGNGTEDDPYLITSYHDLLAMEEYYENNHYASDYYFKLNNNISISNNPDNPVNKMRSIYGSRGLRFDGNGKSITGLCIEDEGYAAFLQNAREIKDLTIRDAVIIVNDSDSGSLPTDRVEAGVFCHKVGTASNCDTFGKIIINYSGERELHAGGMFCFASNQNYEEGIIEDCMSFADLEINSPNNYRTYAGGLLYDGGAKYCKCNGNILANAASGNSNSSIVAGIVYNARGGVTGCHCGRTSEGNISTIAITGENNKAYGIAGTAYSSKVEQCTVDHCTNNATLDAVTETAGIIGIVDSGTIVSDSKNYGLMINAAKRNGIAGRVGGGVLGYCTNYADLSQAAGEANCTICGIAGEVDDNNGNGQFNNNCNEGNLTGHMVLGITRSIQRNAEVSSCVNYGNLTGLYYAAGLCESIGRTSGSYKANVIQCGNEGEIISSQNASGICDRLNIAEISRCYNTGSLQADSGATGIVGSLNAGGLIERCFNNGEISSGSHAAGIVGNISTYYTGSTPRVRNCNNSGTVSGKSSYVGGIVASMNNGYVTQCCNTGEIICEGSGSGNGGIVGQIFINSNDKSCTITDCYNAGTITAKNGAGLVGSATVYECNGEVNISDCYNAGPRNHSGSDGYFYNILYAYDKAGISVSGNYYPENGYSGIYLKSGEAESSFGMTRLSDSQMKQQSSFTGWDFSSIWKMGTDYYQYPILIDSGESVYTITLDANGGTVSTQTLTTSGIGTLSSLPRAKKTGERFMGWYTSVTDGDKITTSTVFSSNTTIYAHWGEYDTSNQVAVTPISPTNGQQRVKLRDYSETVGTINVFKLEFTIDGLVTEMDKTAGSISICDYNTDEVVVSTNKYTDIELTDNGAVTHVTISKLNQFNRLQAGTTYYVCIDEDIFHMEEYEKYVLIDQKDTWTFRTGSNVKLYYRDEKRKTDALLPYEFDWDEIDISRSSYEFNWPLSTFAYGVTLSAFESYSGTYHNGAGNFEYIMMQMGFENIESSSGYHSKPEPNSIGVCAASRNMVINGHPYTVIFMPVRGAGYEAEWASNVKVGKNGDHEGFSEAAGQVESFLQNYLNNHSNDFYEDIKIVVSGYSRAAATANLTAAWLDDHASSLGIGAENIYGFCFEPPATTTSSASKDDLYGNIFNFINPRDLVPKVPSGEWGFTHYGNVYYYPDKEDYSTIYASLYPIFINNFNSLVTYGQYGGSPVRSFIYDEGKFKPFGGNTASMRQWITDLIDCFSSQISRSEYNKQLQQNAYNALQYGIDGEAAGEQFVRDMNIYGDSGAPEILVDVMLFSLSKASTLIGAKSFLAKYALNYKTNFLSGNWKYFEELIPIIRSLQRKAAAKGALDLYAMFCPADKMDSTLRDFYYGKTDDQTNVGQLLAQEHEPIVNFAWHVTCSNKTWYSDGSRRFLKVNCPVNIQLYNKSTDDLAVEIIGEEVRVLGDDPLTAYIDDNGQKVFIIPTDQEYDVHVTATDEGTMDYSVIETSEEEGCLQRIDFQDIAISEGTILEGDILDDSTIGEKYTLKKNDQNLVAEVLNQNEISYYNISLNIVDGRQFGEVSGAGSYMVNEFVKLKALPGFGAEFAGWYDENDDLVSEDEEYRFRVEEDRELTARFNQIDGVIVTPVEDVVYTGSAVKPAVEVYDEKSDTPDSSLKLNVDYTLEYKNNVNVGNKNSDNAPSIIIKGKGNYSKDKTVCFNILPKEIGDGDDFDDALTVTIADRQYNGCVQYSKPTVKYGKVTLKENKDYTLKFMTENGGDLVEVEPVGPGRYTVLVTAKENGNYSGSAKITYDIYEKGKSLNNAVIQPTTLPAQEYTGNAIDLSTIPITVRTAKNGPELIRDTDYEVCYANGANKVNVGTAAISVIGKGSNYGRKNISFRITPYNMTSARIQNGDIRIAVEDVKYMGVELKPAVTVTHRVRSVDGNGIATFDDIVLTEGKDYTLSFTNNKNPARADAAKNAPKVTVKGKGNYTGTVYANFTIGRDSLKAEDLNIYIPNVKIMAGGTLTDSLVKPTISYSNPATGKNVLLAKGKDYDIDIDFTNDPGKSIQRASVAFTFKGNYENDENDGDITGDFLVYTDQVDLRNNAAFTFTPEGDEFIYTGAKITPSVTVKYTFDGQTFTLVNGKDYRVSYQYNINAADKNAERLAPTWTVTGTGTYKGSVYGTFTIKKKELSETTYAVTVEDIKCNGKEQKPSVSVTETSSGKKLAASNYSLEYSSTINATDAATVTVKGKGNYSGEITKEFRVYSQPISSAVFAGISSQTYTGKRIMPAGNLVKGYTDRAKTTALIEGNDYILSYGNNTKIGLGTVTVIGRGTYGGSTTLRFMILPKWLQGIL